MKSFISITHENYEGSISSTPRIRNSKKPSRTHVRNWKHLRFLLCPAKLWKIVGVMDPTKFKKTCVHSRSWWIHKNAYGRIINKSSWEPYCRKRWEFMTALQFGSQVYSYASSYEDSGSESSGGQGIGKIGENFGVEHDESQKYETSDRWSEDVGRYSSFCITNGHLSSEKCWIWGKTSKIQRSSCTPWWCCKRRPKFKCSIHWTRITSITNNSS